MFLPFLYPTFKCNRFRENIVKRKLLPGKSDTAYVILPLNFQASKNLFD